MYEPDMKYCLSCKDEYMPERDTCGVCGGALMTGREVLLQQRQETDRLLQRKGGLTQHDDIVTIFRGSLSEVKRIEAQMVPENIGTRIVGEGGGGCGKGCCSTSEAELQVRREEVADAMAIVDRDFKEMTGFAEFEPHLVDSVYDPSADQSTCPACGFQFSSADHTCPDCGLCFG